MLGLDGQPFIAFLIEFARRASVMKTGTIYQRLCGQILRQLQNMIEDRFLTRSTSRDTGGRVRKVRRNGSDVSAGQVEEAECYQPGNPYQTKQELGRYMKAGQRELNDAQFISTSGPDQTKIGTDYSVTSTAIMNCKTERCLWCPPQASPAVLVHARPSPPLLFRPR